MTLLPAGTEAQLTLTKVWQSSEWVQRKQVEHWSGRRRWGFETEKQGIVLADKMKKIRRKQIFIIHQNNILPRSQWLLWPTLV
jgi:3'-phosphoadenosine 5'-phosphosulfate sulfotransferase (PAPS reductase)/FAD synthetase